MAADHDHRVPLNLNRHSPIRKRITIVQNDPHMTQHQNHIKRYEWNFVVFFLFFAPFSDFGCFGLIRMSTQIILALVQTILHIDEMFLICHFHHVRSGCVRNSLEFH